jgi:hypothetical protein
MRLPNYYAAPGFERAGLKRRDMDWIRARVGDAASQFVPVWRSQNLVVELDEAEPRAIVLTVDTVSVLLGEGDADAHLAEGRLVFLGVIDEKAHFAIDLSHVEAPLDMLGSPALAAAGIPADGGGLPICASSPAGSRATKGRCSRSPARWCSGIHATASAGCAATRR